MSNINQFFDSGSIPIGAYIDMPAGSPNVVVTGSHTYVKTGTLVPADSYPKVPSHFVGNVTLPLDSRSNLTSAGLVNGYNQPRSLMKGPSFVTNGTVTVMIATETAMDTYLYSDDNASWVPRKFPKTAQFLYGGFHTGTKFVLYGSANYMMSSDGINWDYYNAPVAGVVDMCFINNRFFACMQATGYIYTSVDGVSWTKITLTATANSGWNSIGWNGTVYCVTSIPTADQITQTSRTAISTDLTTWTYRDNLPVGDGYNHCYKHQRIIYNSVTAKFYLVGRTDQTYYWNGGGYTANAFIYVTGFYWSSDGITWTLTASAVTISVQDIVVSGTTLYAVGRNAANPVLARSTDTGANWTQQITGAFFSAYAYDILTRSPVVVLGGNLYSAVGGYYSLMGTMYDYVEVVTSSNGGTSWTSVIKQNCFCDFTAVAFGQGLILVSLGYNYMNTVPSYSTGAPLRCDKWSGSYLYSSDNGVTWKAKKMPKLGVYNDIKFDGTYWYMIAQYRDATTTANVPLLYRSANGIDWTELTLPVETIIYDKIHLLPGKVILTGYAASTIYSAVSVDSGATWTSGSATPMYTSSMLGVWVRNSAINGKLLAIPSPCGASATYYIATTLDGLSWTLNTSPLGNAAATVISDGTGFYVFYQYSTQVYYTLDFITYSARGVVDAAYSTIIYGNAAYSNGTLYVSHSAGMYTSSDGGWNWTKRASNNGGQQLTVNGGIAISYSASSLYTGIAGQFLRTADLVKSNVEGTAVKYMRVD